MIFKLQLSKNVHILWIYLIVIYCRVNCFLVNVTRNRQDVFSYPSLSIGCHKICEERNSRSTVKNLHICRCKCERNHSTFVISKLKCVADSMLRNTGHGDMFFQLSETEYGNERLKVISINPGKTLIPFKVKLESKKKCVLNKIETLSHRSLKLWKSAKKGLKWKIIELDDDDIEETYNWLPLKYEGWMLLSLQWRNKRRKYKGHIMRLNISCIREKITLSGFLIFKVNGTITVSVNETLSLALSHSIDPSNTSLVSSMSVFSSKPEDSLQFLPSSLIPSSSSMIPLSSQISPLAPSMNILPPLVTTPLSRHNVTSSKLMTSHPLQHRNATMNSSSSVVVFSR
ncbi:uncharacterized protein LOC124433957 [Xenia sp. Carnegie-2017]|uniref:uncharacterized protein LOC124433957 n=1 Tax=Xenia sp. Carnegie-2017 TaxID=2897299 RepID=UPI001F034A59|nr:uncharacterized protein LOC124433957 [Xenia sp. Carnegie-2017]